MAEPATPQAQPETEGRTQVTYEDYLEIPNDGRRWEIIDGAPYVSPAPRPHHQAVLLRLGHLLEQFLDEHSLGRVLVAPVDVVLSEIDVVQPDLLYLSAERLGLVTDRGVEGTPNLVAEILSESTRRIDEKIKLALYERHGVEEYWVIDPVLETVKVRRREGDRFGQPAVLDADAGATLTTPLLSDLEISLAELFSKARISRR